MFSETFVKRVRKTRMINLGAFSNIALHKLITQLPEFSKFIEHELKIRENWEKTIRESNHEDLGSF